MRTLKRLTLTIGIIVTSLVVWQASAAAATAIEYGLIAALIAVAAITAMQGLGTALTKTFDNVSSSMNG